MSKALRWILYILLGLVVLAIIVGIVFAVFGGYRYTMMGQGFRMMGPMRYYSFSPLRTIFGGLFGLGVFILVIVGIVALINALVRTNRPIPSNPPAAMTTPATATPATTTPTRTCSNCGKPAQDDWKTCPYCGSPLT